MDADFWLARWREEQTGFHQQRVTPLLMKYWPTLGLPEGCRVLVPLCGKSLDMIYFLSLRISICRCMTGALILWPKPVSH